MSSSQAIDNFNSSSETPKGPEETLESHEVIELQTFIERKAWIEDRIRFLGNMPPIEVFVGLEALESSAEHVPGLPSRAELQQWIIEHDAIEKETEIFDTGELKKLRNFTRAATQRNLSPEDTDLIELTLTTIYELDKLLHLLRDRSENLDLLGIRLTWEEHRIASWRERRNIIADLQAFLEQRARWSTSVYSEPVDHHSPSPENLAHNSDDLLSLPAFSRSNRFKVAEMLSRDAAQFTSRISTLRHGSITSAGKVLDKLIDNTRKPVPEILLDEQEKLEEQGINDMEHVGKFIMNVVMQWRKADEIYVESLKDQVTAKRLLEELEAAKGKHPDPSLCASFTSRSDALGRRLTLRGYPHSPGSTFPCPVHPLFSDQDSSNASLARYLTSEIDTVVSLSKKARTSVEEYRSRLEAVQRVETSMQAADALVDTFLSVIDRFEHGVSSSEGDGSPPNLMSQACLDPTKHSVFLALLPSLKDESLKAEQNAEQLLRSMPPALLRLDFSGINPTFKENVTSTMQRLSTLRTRTQNMREDIVARTGRLRESRKIWDSMNHCLKEVAVIRMDIAEAMEMHRWRGEAHHSDTPPTPESPPSVPFPNDHADATFVQRISEMDERLTREIDAPLASLSQTLEEPLREHLKQSAVGLQALLGQIKVMVQLLAYLQNQTSAMNTLQEQFFKLQLHIENLKVSYDSHMKETLDGKLAGDELTTAVNDLQRQSSEVRKDVSTFVTSLSDQVPFISQRVHNVTFLKRQFSSADLQHVEDQPIEIPFEVQAVDDAARSTANMMTMRLNGDLHALEQKERYFKLSQLAKEVDVLLSQSVDQINKAVAEVSAASSSFSTIMVNDDKLHPLGRLLEHVQEISRTMHRQISPSFSPIRALLRQMEENPAVTDPAVHESLYKARTRSVDDAELKFTTWDESLVTLCRRIEEARQTEFHRLEDTKRAEELRLQAEKEAEQARIAAEKLLQQQREAEERRREEEERAAEEHRRLEEQRAREEAETAEFARLARESAEEAERKRLEEERLEAERRELAEKQRLALEQTEKARLQRERSEMEVKLRLAEQELANQRRLQAEKDATILRKETMTGRSDPEEDVFGSHVAVNRPTTAANELYGRILKLRKRLSSLSKVISQPNGTDALPTSEESRQMNQNFLAIETEASALPQSVEDPTVDTELNQLRLDIDSISKELVRMDQLAALSTKIEACDALLSDLLEHIDSYPAVPPGPLSSSYQPPLDVSPDSQLSARLLFTKSTIDELSSAFAVVANDRRALAEHERIMQTWQELQEMANDRIVGRKSRPSSVISSVSRPSSVVSSVGSNHSGRASIGPKSNAKAIGYSNLSARNRLGPPSSTPRRAFSASDQPPERPSTSARSYNRSTSGSHTLYGTTFASRQRTTSLTSSTGTPNRRASGPAVTPTPRTKKRSASPSVSDVSHSNTAPRSSTSASTWSRAPRLSFVSMPRATPQKKPPRKNYVANPKNKLDVAVGDVVNSLPVGISIEGVSGSWKDQSGKYWIGDQDPKLCFCRILRSQTVMVRVGGGWTELSKFIRDHFAESFRILESPPYQNAPREEKWISSATLLEAPENGDSPPRVSAPKTPEPKDPHLPSFSLSSPSGSPHSLRSTPSTKGSPLAALQFMRRADPDAPFLRPETPSKTSHRPRNTPINTPARNSIWRP